MYLPIDLLQTFVVVAERKNFTTAGKQIHRSQSAVSMQMKRLSETVGKPLFDMEGKRMHLSPIGELVLEHAQKILKVHDDAANAINFSKSKGLVRLGAPEDYASLFVPRILVGFAQEYPDIRVDVICLPSTQIYSNLLEDKLDLAICTALGINGEEIYREPVVWVTHAGGGALLRSSIPLAVYGNDCIYRRWAVEALEEAGRTYHIAYMSPSIAGILAAVRSGLAVAPVGLSVATENLRIIGQQEGFPALPAADVSLHKSANPKNKLIDKLAAHVRESFKGKVVSQKFLV